MPLPIDTDAERLLDSRENIANQVDALDRMDTIHAETIEHIQRALECLSEGRLMDDGISPPRLSPSPAEYASLIEACKAVLPRVNAAFEGAYPLDVFAGSVGTIESAIAAHDNAKTAKKPGDPNKC